MRITELLRENCIALQVDVQSKEETIDYLVDLISESGIIPDKEEYKQGILLRESLGTTAIGDEIAIPHAQLDSVKAPGIAAITVKNGVDYEAPDGKDVKLCFIIAAPKTGDNLHLQALAKLSTLLMNPSFKETLLQAKTTEEFLHIINMAENEKDMLDAEPEEKKNYRVLAVTACPTGIAHTFMAAESLTQAGEQMGYLLKAETNGADGAKNVLTEEEIEKADGIIIAADKNVEMARFDGKPVLVTSVSQGIQKPEELIQKVIDKKVPVYHHEGEKVVEAEGNFYIMAAVMAGGMIPPLAIALSTTLFKNRWTKEERESGLVNYIMGLSFISEGAIPFAAKDPIRVIPSCIIGSATAGGLSMAFNCTLRAPHGGIFVLPTIGHPLMYALAIFIGALVGCLVLSFLKKPLPENKR